MKTLYALALVLLTGTAAAQVTYDYTSGPIASVTYLGGSVGFSAPALGTDITGVITLASALPENGTTYVAPLSESFSVPIRTVSFPGGAPEAQFVFTTAAGQITGFNFLYSTSNVGGESLSESLTASSASNTASYAAGADGASFTVQAGAGSWVDPPATFAVNTSETKTGGGGALELFVLLSVMGIRRCRIGAS